MASRFLDGHMKSAFVGPFKRHTKKVYLLEQPKRVNVGQPLSSLHSGEVNSFTFVTFPSAKDASYRSVEARR